MTTPNHKQYFGWNVYEDPECLWEGARWVGCSDVYETCVSGATMSEVLMDIDDIIEGERV
jgi:hypothetical protein